MQVCPWYGSHCKQVMIFCPLAPSSGTVKVLQCVCRPHAVHPGQAQWDMQHCVEGALRWVQAVPLPTLLLSPDSQTVKTWHHRWWGNGYSLFPPSLSSCPQSWIPGVNTVCVPYLHLCCYPWAWRHGSWPDIHSQVSWCGQAIVRNILFVHLSRCISLMLSWRSLEVS